MAPCEVGPCARLTVTAKPSIECRMKRALVLACLVPCLPSSGFSQLFTNANGWVYSINVSDEAVIVNYKGPSGDLAVPSAFNGIPVRFLGSGSRSILSSDYGGPVVSNLVIPASVREIRNGAFSGYQELRTVTIAGGVAVLGPNAFSNCKRLTRINLPESVASIGEAAFSYCENLADLSVGTGLTNIGPAAFEGCNSLTNIVLPDSLGVIADRAFWSCTSLTNLTVGRGLRSIGQDSFSYCPNLASILFTGDAPTLNSQRGGPFEDTPATVYRLEGAAGWGSTFHGRPVALFRPQALPPSFVAGAFRFSWSTPVSVPMEVLRTPSLGATWSVVSTNNSTGVFTDTQPPAGGAFYRAVLP